jgi:RimJ/RimL family protein N-acetyltransferase
MKIRITETNSLNSKRFILRDLSCYDANEIYLSWFKDEITSKFILASKTTFDLADLKNYIRKRTNLDSVRFFGIFDKVQKKHIGNIKYEPINFSMSYAIMGVLIGEPSFRGIGVFREVYSISAQYIRKTYNIKKIFLGVDKKNLAAIKSYEKSGFVITNDHPMGEGRSGILMMVDLFKPNFK